MSLGDKAELNRVGSGQQVQIGKLLKSYTGHGQVLKPVMLLSTQCTGDALIKVLKTCSVDK